MTKNDDFGVYLAVLGQKSELFFREGPTFFVNSRVALRLDDPIK